MTLFNRGRGLLGNNTLLELKMPPCSPEKLLYPHAPCLASEESAHSIVWAGAANAAAAHLRRILKLQHRRRAFPGLTLPSFECSLNALDAGTLNDEHPYLRTVKTRRSSSDFSNCPMTWVATPIARHEPPSHRAPKSTHATEHPMRAQGGGDENGVR
ncbi:hypothetical protein B0H11DRAFT_1940241 [Mycena galericulata]|nr:hypothetical protein B0H11DRAFT_1940241 [Mycena galericulata]